MLLIVDTARLRCLRVSDYYFFYRLWLDSNLVFYTRLVSVIQSEPLFANMQLCCSTPGNSGERFNGKWDWRILCGKDGFRRKVLRIIVHRWEGAGQGCYWNCGQKGRSREAQSGYFHHHSSR